MRVIWTCGTESYDISEYVERVTWEGSDTQVSRTATITVPYNYYKDLYLNIRPGHLLTLTEQKEIFAGVVTNQPRRGQIGAVSYTAKDFMHYLLRSSGSYNFKKTTPEKITRKVCSDLMIQTGDLYETKKYLPSLLFDNESYYNIIVKSYNAAARKMSAAYPPAFMPIMDKRKLSVIIKGQHCGIVLDGNNDIISSEYEESTEEMINRVKVLNKNGKVTGTVENTDDINEYGVYQATYKKTGNENAKTAAAQMLTGITRTAKVEAIGYAQCRAGYAVNIRDGASGLLGKYYIENDSHTWENGTHIMNIGLKFSNELEESR